MSVDFSDPRWAMFTPQQNDANRPQFGTRYLTDESAVYTQNAWDHVPPPTDQGDIISAALEKQRKAPVSEEEKEKLNTKPSNYWNNFYKQNDENFFRDRKWLIREFPELMLCSLPDAGTKSIVEIGCGAGNTVFPIISDNKNPELTVHGFDYSAHAVKLVQRNPLYTAPPCGNVHAEVWDLSSPGLPPGVKEGSVDVAVMVFVMSALHPDEWNTALENVYRMLKPGGLACIRDYGRHDLTQLRFKGGRLLEDNFYIRGDKTRVYFFELDELALMFTGARAPAGAATMSTTQDAEEEEGVGTPSGGSQRLKTTSSMSESASSASVYADSPLVKEADTPTTPSIASSATIRPPTDSANIQDSTDPVVTEVNSSVATVLHPNLLALEQGNDGPRYKIEQIHVDRRLLVNRKKQLKMYRVWMQGQFRKI